MDILIIEPDRLLAQQYQKAFEKAGYKTIACSDAQAAVMVIDKNRPKAVIIEIQLATHNGLEFLHEFRSYEDWTDIPIFIYSRIPEYALGANSKTWQSLGVERYFYKPHTSLARLIGVVKEVIN